MSNRNFSLSWTRECEQHEEECYIFDIDDYSDLDKFLLANASPEGCTSVTMADGFITALRVGPNNLLGIKYLGWEFVWGEPPTTRSEKKDWPKHKRKMLGILDSIAGEASYMLDEDQHKYRPLLAKVCKAKSKIKVDRELPSVILWCRGFVKAFNHFPAAWADMFEDPIGRDVLGAIFFFGGTNGWTHEREINDHRLKDFRKAFKYHIPYYVFTVKDFFQTPTGLKNVREMNHYVADFWSPPTAYADAVAIS